MIRSYGKNARLAALGLAAAAALSLAPPAFAREEPANIHDTRLRPPTAAERKALAAGIEALLKSSPSSRQVKQTADGTMSVDPGTSFLSITVALVGPDGTIHQVCVGAAAADNLVIPPLYEDR